MNRPQNPRPLLLRAAQEQCPIEAVRMVEAALTQLRAEAKAWTASGDILDLLRHAEVPLTTRQVARAFQMVPTTAKARLSDLRDLGQVRRFGEGAGTTWGAKGQRRAG